MSPRKAVPLAEAWREYFDVLMTKDTDWQSALARWVRSNLVAFQEGVYHTELPLNVGDLSWADSVTLRCEPDGATVSVGDYTFETSRWSITGGPFECPHSSWTPFYNLIHRLDANEATVRTWRAQAEILIRTVTRLTGNRLADLFFACLQDQKLKATGLSERSGFTKRIPLGAEQLKVIKRPSLKSSAIETNSGLVLLEAVEISLGPNFIRQVSSSNFHDEDQLLVEEIEELANREKLSGKEATRRLGHKIRKMSHGQEEHAFERVYKKWGSKFGPRVKAKRAQAEKAAKDRR